LKLVAITGSHGLIGNALIPYLETCGFRVIRLARNQLETLPENLEAVIHLAGANISEGRWTPARKRELLESRTVLTAKLISAFRTLKSPPRVLLCASGSGFYGNRSDELLVESSSHGSGFLADVCKQWEGIAEQAAQYGSRVVTLRMGIVLSSAGGALPQMITPFRYGLGGWYGNGRQYMSWIAIEDTLQAIQFLIENENIIGPVNIVSPQPLSNRDFMTTLARTLSRPCIFPVPEFMLKIILGEMAGSLLFYSTRMLPEVLIDNGFQYQSPLLEPTLRKILHAE